LAPVGSPWLDFVFNHTSIKKKQKIIMKNNLLDMLGHKNKFILREWNSYMKQSELY